MEVNCNLWLRSRFGCFRKGADPVRGAPKGVQEAGLRGLLRQEVCSEQTVVAPQSRTTSRAEGAGPPGRVNLSSSRRRQF